MYKVNMKSIFSENAALVAYLLFLVLCGLGKVLCGSISNR